MVPLSLNQTIQLVHQFLQWVLPEPTIKHRPEMSHQSTLMEKSCPRPSHLRNLHVVVTPSIDKNKKYSTIMKPMFSHLQFSKDANLSRLATLQFQAHTPKEQKPNCKIYRKNTRILLLHSTNRRSSGKFIKS
jgi:hypothetical protein